MWSALSGHILVSEKGLKCFFSKGAIWERSLDSERGLSSVRDIGVQLAEFERIVLRHSSLSLQSHILPSFIGLLLAILFNLWTLWPLSGCSIGSLISLLLSFAKFPAGNEAVTSRVTGVEGSQQHKQLLLQNRIPRLQGWNTAFLYGSVIPFPFSLFLKS